MLIPLDELVQKYGIQFTGILHVGAHECEEIEYYHLECENHSSIYANGVLPETYLDFNNRDGFENSIKFCPKKKCVNYVK